MNGQYRNKMERNKTLLLLALGLTAGVGAVVFKKMGGFAASQAKVFDAIRATENGGFLLLTSNRKTYRNAMKVAKQAKEENNYERFKVLFTSSDVITAAASSAEFEGESAFAEMQLGYAYFANGESLGAAGGEGIESSTEDIKAQFTLFIYNEIPDFLINPLSPIW